MTTEAFKAAMILLDKAKVFCDTGVFRIQEGAPISLVEQVRSNALSEMEKAKTLLELSDAK